MRKCETMTTDTGRASEPAALTDKDLDAVTGGATTLKLLDACAKAVDPTSGHERWIAVESYSWSF